VFFELLVLIVYILLGCGAWGIYGFAIWWGREKMLLMKRPAQPIPIQPPPSATIFIPAKDEGERIRGCIQSALNQDYPAARVVAIDDRSSDRTGAIMDEMARADPRLTVLHITQPPANGWTGKNNALYTAAKDAAAAWLLFVDSDVVLAKDALSAALSVVTRKKFDLLSLLPRLESHSLWESLLVPMAGSAASSLYLIALTNSSHYTGPPFANGQFLLISRAAYDAIGGHATVRDRFCEDVELANLLKKKGLRPRVSWGNDFAAVRMYDSLPNILRGWSRIFYAARVGSPRTALTGLAFLLFCCFSVYPALAWGIFGLFRPNGVPHPQFSAAWTIVGGVHLTMLTFCVAVMYHWCGNPRRNTLYFPISATLLGWIFLKTLKLCITKKVEWRGTAYAHTMVQNLPVDPSGSVSATSVATGSQSPGPQSPDSISSLPSSARR
jgi:cellulose synthase/poly-beta-1,6-N-acetylglucosamine synthase-like glycosyltransferase